MNKRYQLVWNYRGQDEFLKGTAEEVVDQMIQSGLVKEDRADFKEGVRHRIAILYEERIPTESCESFIDSLIENNYLERVQ